MSGKPFALLTALTVAVLGCDSPETAVAPDLETAFANNPVVQSVSGGGHYYWHRTGEWRTNTIHAVKKPNGSVTGRWHIRVHRNQGFGAKMSGTITCLTIEGNQAWLAGYVTHAVGDHVGKPYGFRVRDNGEGTNAAAPDAYWSYRFLIFWTSPEDFCGPNRPYDGTLAPIVAGNFQVR